MKPAWPSALALLFVASALAWKSLHPAPKLDARGFVDGLPHLRADLKLAVASMDLTKTVTGESRKTAFGFDWGTTRAVVTVPVRVHYAVDLSGPDAVTLDYDPRTRTVVAEFPAPKILAVEVSTREKRAVVAAGWARAEAFSGRALLDRLDRDLDRLVRADAQTPGALALAMGAARPALEKLVADYADRMGFRAATVVRFRGEG